MSTLYEKNGISWTRDENGCPTIYWTDKAVGDADRENYQYCFNIGKSRYKITMESSIRDYKYVKLTEASEDDISTISAREMNPRYFISFIRRNIYGNENLIPVCKVTKLPDIVYGALDYELLKDMNNIIKALKQLVEDYVKPEDASIDDDDRYTIYKDEATGIEVWFNKSFGTYSGGNSEYFIYRPIVLAFLHSILNRSREEEFKKVTSSFFTDVTEEFSVTIDSSKEEEVDMDAIFSKPQKQMWVVEHEEIQEKSYSGSAMERLNQRNADQ